MTYGVYMESSLSMSLGENVFKFLTKLVEKAKGVKDFAISIKKEEVAEELDISLSSVKRYLSKLEGENLITVQGVRGKGKGTVVMFNTDFIRFETSEKAFANSDKPISIDDIVQRKIPNKPKKEPKWSRRSKDELLKASVLKNTKQAEVDKLNDELEQLGGVPNWEWLEKTADPVGNYRTYLISAMYHQFAAVFVEDNNFWMLAGNKLPVVKSHYNVFGQKWNRFYGTSQWTQLEKFRKFCEEKEIDPAVYLSAQFSRSTFTAASTNQPKKARPFLNTLWGETSYEVYKDYVLHKKAYKRNLYAENADFVITALRQAYNTAYEVKGFSMFKGSITDLLEEEGSTDKEVALKDFYLGVLNDCETMELSAKTKETLDKFVLTQILIECGGARRIPAHFILGAEMTEVAIQSIKKFHPNDDVLLAKALGNMVHPYEKPEEQLKKGCHYVQHYHMINNTPQIFRLIMERQGVSVTLADVNAAIKEYGKTNLALNDYSFLDIDKVIAFMGDKYNFTKVEHSDADMENYTQTKEYVIVESKPQAVLEIDSLIDGLDFNN